MSAFIAQLVTFLVALIGTFFKCVKEDAHGRPLRSSRGLPVLTGPGKYILTLLVASFVSSIWLTHDSSQEMTELQKNLKAALAKQSELSDQLRKANEQIQEHQTNAQADNVQRLNQVTQKLEGTTDLLTSRITDLLPVRSFMLLLFFESMSRPARAPNAPPIEHRPAVPGETPGVFYDMICGSGVDFDIQISSDPEIVLHSICGLAELREGGSSIPLTIFFERWEQGQRGMVVAFTRSAEFIDAPSFVDPITVGTFTTNSIAIDPRGFAWFTIHRVGPVDALMSLGPVLPRYVGFSATVNDQGLDPHLTWVYGPRERASASRMLAFGFRDSKQCRVSQDRSTFANLGRHWVIPNGCPRP